jgi:hypothetical protein
MKLSKETLDVLRNFATINANILIKKGSSLSTLAVAQNIMAMTNVPEKFDKEVGIFNLPELLGVISMMGDPEIKLEEKYMTLTEGKTKVKYVYADSSILKYPKKDIELPSVDVSFDLSSSNLMQLQKAAAALGVQDVAIVGDGEKITLKVTDKKSDSSNQYTIDLETKSSEEFTVYFKIENFKQIPDDYKVEISKKNISKFTGQGLKVTYFVAIEQDSDWS